MRQQRSYVQPSCVLQVWWEEGGYIDNRSVIHQLGFILRFGDQQTLAGDLAQLWALVHSIDAYIQKFLSQDHLPAMVHGVMGLTLTSGQLIDASNAIEEFRSEVLLLPATASSPSGNDWVKSVVVGLSALTIGAGIGLWLASRQPRSLPSVVVTPSAPPEVFTDTPPPSAPPPVVEPKPPQETEPPITVYPRPPAPPPLEKIKSPLPPVTEESPPDDRELLAPEAPAGIASRSSNELTSNRDNTEAVELPPTITIERVDISTSELLTQDLINYLRSVTLPQGKVTVDVTVEEGRPVMPSIENGSAEDSTTWAKLLEGWNPTERSGRVRLQVSVP
ncbi:MAG: hypothetical protein CV045_05510 [Cyanobacteria bacterium M5B4]|nr:MAG: hypothetical protein CV045_05510 [Cyanobacteria bacterium M5B4]